MAAMALPARGSEASALIDVGAGRRRTGTTNDDDGGGGGGGGAARTAQVGGGSGSEVRLQPDIGPLERPR